jgi:Pyridoxamine 5'-phosphate oxidase
MTEHSVGAELADTGAQALLRDATLLRLAYTGIDGLPRVVPVGFWWTGTQLVICTAVTAPKVAALRPRPEVAVTIDIGDTPASAKALLIRGEATLETVDGIRPEYLSAVAKGLDADQVAGFEVQASKMYDQMVRIAITPTWARFYDFGVGRMPRFLQELAAAQQG